MAFRAAEYVAKTMEESDFKSERRRLDERGQGGRLPQVLVASSMASTSTLVRGRSPSPLPPASLGVRLEGEGEKCKSGARARLEVFRQMG